jgi:EmrB/QacA subfamily drug resistance transporter
MENLFMVRGYARRAKIPCRRSPMKCGQRRRGGNPLPRSISPVWVLAATILGSSLVFIDGTVVSLALPVIQRELGATALQMQWVIEAYTLVLGALMLLCGALGDRYGRKRIFIGGVVIFALGSILCGASPSVSTLIAARVLQGLGGTMLAPASLAILGACFSGDARGKAIGTWSGLTTVASTVGPLLGGVVIDHLGWRWAFYINIPIAAAVVTIALLHVPESRDDGATGTLDVLGSLLITLGLGFVVYAFVTSGSTGWNATTLVTLAFGVVALAAFLRVESVVATPILPLKLFKSEAFSGLNAMTFLLYGALGALFYFLPFVLIQVDGMSATMAGAASLPFIVLMVALSRFSGGLVYRLGARTLLTAGPAVAALGFACFALLPDLHYWTGIFPSQLLFGLGMGLTVSPLTTTLLDSVPPNHIGLASGINNAVSRVAGLLAIAVLGALLAFVFTARLETRMSAAALPEGERTAIRAQKDAMAGAQFPIKRDGIVVKAAYVDAFRGVAAACALLAAASALTAGLTLGKKRSTV